MRVTKRTITAMIKQLGFDPSLFRVDGNEIETTREDYELGNSEVEWVVKHLVKKGAPCYGFRAGYGAWIYRFEHQSGTSKLASLNID